MENGIHKLKFLDYMIKLCEEILLYFRVIEYIVYKKGDNKVMYNLKFAIIGIQFPAQCAGPVRSVPCWPGSVLMDCLTN